MKSINLILVILVSLLIGSFVNQLLYPVPEPIIINDAEVLNNQLLLNYLLVELNNTNTIVSSQQSLLFKILNSKNNITVKNTISDLVFIDEARKRFDNIRTYSDDYDCSMYTKDFIDYMRDGFGIDLFGVYAFKNFSNYGHAFTCIPYDPQSGFYDKNLWDEYTFVERSLQ